MTSMIFRWDRKKKAIVLNKMEIRKITNYVIDVSLRNESI